MQYFYTVIKLINYDDEIIIQFYLLFMDKW